MQAKVTTFPNSLLLGFTRNVYLHHSLDEDFAAKFNFYAHLVIYALQPK